MGSGASTSTTRVQRIRIDENGDIWKLRPDGTEKLSQPGSSKSALIPIAKRIRNSVSSGGNRSGICLSNDALQSRLATSERRRIAVEEGAMALQHEMNLLQMRNVELAEEVTWLKSQLANAPNASESPGQRRLTGETAETSGPEVSSDENLKLELQRVRTDYEKRLSLERELRERMEDVVRIHLGDAFLREAKSSLAHDFLPIDGSFKFPQPLARSAVNSSGRLTTPQQLLDESLPNVREEPTIVDELIHDTVCPPNKHEPGSHNDFDRSSLDNGESSTIVYKRSKPREARLQFRRKLDMELDKMSVQSHNTIDDDIEDILNQSLSSMNNSIQSGKTAMSAKSRDSGFLGDSGYLGKFGDVSEKELKPAASNSQNNH